MRRNVIKRKKENWNFERNWLPDLKDLNKYTIIFPQKTPEIQNKRDISYQIRKQKLQIIQKRREEKKKSYSEILQSQRKKKVGFSLIFGLD